MTTTNLNAAPENDPKDKDVTNDNLPTMNDDHSNDMEEDTEDEDEQEEKEDEDEDYTILPSNDSGITNDDNAATGELHQREGD